MYYELRLATLKYALITDYESEGRAFESLRVRHMMKKGYGNVALFLLPRPLANAAVSFLY